MNGPCYAQVLQKLVKSADMVGEALVPYYRQILPILNAYKTNKKCLGDGIQYGQRRRDSLGELIEVRENKRKRGVGGRKDFSTDRGAGTRWEKSLR